MIGPVPFRPRRVWLSMDRAAVIESRRAEEAGRAAATTADHVGKVDRMVASEERMFVTRWGVYAVALPIRSSISKQVSHYRIALLIWPVKSYGF